MTDNSKKDMPCENLEFCNFFQQFKAHQEVIKQGWIRTYCQSSEQSNTCVRKKIKKETGQAPAPNIAPTGKVIN